ncbi:MAG: S1 RNA-binding domain-containing protein [Chloroflexota bacterium]|nr:S1 RNA-binding domain-containing protein [Dehalococcoidia bacterium]MDW8253087.1 S1 RNA-binding domain-containing protein [Chloroflexota bacterium]
MTLVKSYQDHSTDENGLTMQELLDAKMGTSYAVLRRGDVIEGSVVAIDREGILVDIGGKSEGHVPANEATCVASGEEPLKVGDTVLVYVVQPEDVGGVAVLSVDRARAERGWRRIQQLYETQAIFEAEVVDFNKGGLIVSIDGVRGFLPSSQVMGLRTEGGAEAQLEERLKEMVGRTLRLKVVDVNRRRNRVILSERAAMQEWRSQQKERLLGELAPGDVRRGVITSVTSFGAFVDLGGADGLIHLSELSWDRVEHPSEVVKPGDEVNVYVMNVDPETKKIGLSLRRAQGEPWQRVLGRYSLGQLVTGKITKLTSFGAFARLEEGIEGLIHVSELSDRRITHPREVVREGDVLTLKVVKIEPERHRLGLSLRQAVEDLGEDAFRGRRNDHD